MKPVRFTRRAEVRLRNIAEWTARRFGRRQAERYRDSLLCTASAISRGEAISRPCSALLPGNPRAGELRCILVGRHYLVFVEREDAIILLDFVHGSRDIAQAVEDLPRA